MTMYKSVGNYEIKENENYEILQVSHQGYLTEVLISIFDSRTSKEKNVKVSFDSSFSTRIADEGKILRSQYRDDINYDSNVKDNLIFQSEDSEYLNWFKKETNDVYSDDFDFIHYQIFALNEIADVISNTAPRIEEISDMDS